jgi:2-polyprenyl-3-methyl-5-hydroxy-6-metoxy-1,4-benzoquinol methylase
MMAKNGSVSIDKKASRGHAPSARAEDGHYAHYEEWKCWETYFEFDAEDAEYYAGELRGVPLVGKRVLEIGFGTGSFLAWARTHGARIAGTEINERSLAEAKRLGVELLDPAIEHIEDQHAGCFDVVVGFDVFEHFDLEEIQARIRAAETMLKPGGFIVLRFPNGQSPFGLAPQNGDVTHKTALAKEKMEQICHGARLEAVRYTGSYGVRGPWGPTRVVRAFRRFAQGMIGASLNLIYATDIPWDPVVVLVLRKLPTGPRDATTHEGVS